jgi:hypothetical protein
VKDGGLLVKNLGSKITSMFRVLVWKRSVSQSSHSSKGFIRIFRNAYFSNDCSIVYVRQQRSKKGHKIEKFPKKDAGIRDIGLHPDLAVSVQGA